MRSRIIVCVALAALVGCESEAPDDEVTPIRSPTIPRIVTLREALGSSEVSTLDPHTMNDAEISSVLGAEPYCAFRYVSDGNPVLAWKPQASNPPNGVVKLNGLLVELERGADTSAWQFRADEARLTLTTDSNARERSNGPQPREGKLLFEIGQQLRVGYEGYFICPR